METTKYSRSLPSAYNSCAGPVAEIIRLWTGEEGLRRRGSSYRTTGGLLFAGGLQSFRRPAERQPLQCLRKVAAAHYPLQADCECETRQALRPWRQGLSRLDRKSTR